MLGYGDSPGGGGVFATSTSVHPQVDHEKLITLVVCYASSLDLCTTSYTLLVWRFKSGNSAVIAHVRVPQRVFRRYQL